MLEREKEVEWQNSEVGVVEIESSIAYLFHSEFYLYFSI